jgi:hypothetical protein
MKPVIGEADLRKAWNAWAIAEFNDAQIDAVFDQHGLTPQERARVNHILLDADSHDVARANFEALKILAARPKPIEHPRIRRVRELCDVADWYYILWAVSKYPPDQVADGRAQADVYNKKYGTFEEEL